MIMFIKLFIICWFTGQQMCFNMSVCVCGLSKEDMDVRLVMFALFSVLSISEATWNWHFQIVVQIIWALAVACICKAQLSLILRDLSPTPAMLGSLPVRLLENAQNLIHVGVTLCYPKSIVMARGVARIWCEEDGGAEWCGRTSTKETPVVQPSSSPTGAASLNTAGFQKEWHCRGPAVTEQAILLVTGTRIWRQTGGRSAAIAIRRSSQKRSSSHGTSLKHQHRCKYRDRGRRWLA